MEGWGSRPLDLGVGVVGVSMNYIIISYNAKKYDMRTLSKVVIFQKFTDLCILNKNVIGKFSYEMTKKGNLAV